MKVFDTFQYVLVRSARNRVVVQLKRLKQPRYAIATLFGLGYWWLYFGRYISDARHLGRMPSVWSGSAAAVFTGVGLLAVLSVWVFGSSQTSLTFSEAEIQFFFPAPTTRRSLLNYKLLKSMLLAMLTTALSTLFFGRGAPGREGFFFVGFWLAICTLSFHSVAAARTRQALVEHGAVGWRSTLPTVLVVVVFAGAFAFALGELWPLPKFEPNREWVDRVTGLVRIAPLAWVLWPIQAFANVIFAPDGFEFLRALPFAIGVMGLHYLWVLAGDTSFEDSSVRASEARARALEQRRAGGRTEARRTKRDPPFTLSAAGPPEVALIWKGIIASGRVLTARALVTLALPLIVCAAALGLIGGLDEGLGVAGLVLMVIWAMVAISGGALGAGNLRRDVEYFELLRSMPLLGRQVVIGQALGALAPIAVFQWVVLALGLVLLRGSFVGTYSAAEKVPVGLALALLGPVFSLAGILVQTAVVIFLPAWTGTGAARPQGPEAVGLSFLVLIGNLLTVALGMLPATIVGALVGFATLPLLGNWALVSAALAIAGVAAFEAWLAAAVMGRAFDAFEPSV